MPKPLDIIRNTRKRLSEMADGHTLEQLNRIPEKYNNNLAWNLGHVVASQQVLCYELSALPPTVDATIMEKFRRGTKPEAWIAQEEIERIKKLLVTSIDQFEKDLESGLFKIFTPFTTAMGIQLASIEDTIPTIIFHEGLHLGYMMAMRKLVG